MTVSRRQQEGLLLIGIAVVSVAVAVVTTWPLVTRLSTHLPDRFNDAFLHLWNTWWVETALRQGRWPMTTDYLFYPSGVSLITHNIAWFHVLPALGFSLFVNNIAAYNLAVLLNLALCGVAAFWLTYRLTHNGYAAFLAALVYQTWPYRVARLDLPNLLATFWIPPFLLFLHNTLRYGRRRDAVLTGVCFALVGYARWQHLIPATIMGLVLFLFAWSDWWPGRRVTGRLSRLRRRTPAAADPNPPPDPGAASATGRQDRQRSTLARLVMAGGVALVLLLPPLLGLSRAIAGEDGLSRLLYPGEAVVMSSDLLAFLTPREVSPLWGEQTRPLYEQYYADRETTRRRPAYLGLVALILAGAGVYFRPRQSRPWIGMALVLMLLALGPVLRVNGQLYEDVPTLYRALSPLGVLQLMRNPERFTMFVALPLSVLVAFGAAGLWPGPAGRPGGQWARGLALAATALCGLLILVDVYAPQTIFKDVTTVSPFLRQLGQAPGQTAILNLPVDDLKGSIYMFEQVAHRQPILQGNLSRIPPEAYAYLDANPWLRTLRQANEMPPALTDVSRQLDRLAQDGIGTIVVHKELVGADRVAHWDRYLAIQPFYEDESVRVYTTSPRAGRDFSLLAEPAPGLGPIRTVLSSDCGMAGQRMELDVAWGSLTAGRRDYDVMLSLQDGAGQAWPVAHFPLAADWPTSSWPAGAVAWGAYPFTLPAAVPPGDYWLTLTPVDVAAGDSPGTPWPARALTVASAGCPFTVPATAVIADASFDRLRLLHTSLEQEGNTARLALLWRADQRPDTDYTLFVHVFDLATDMPVAQYDGMPHQGAYPTSFWWPGEAVAEQVTIRLDGVPPGAYGVAIGVYNGMTGERLTLVTTGGAEAADGRYVLPEQVTVPAAE